jgi:DNA-binding MarR family transcriptional regulator
MARNGGAAEPHEITSLPAPLEPLFAGDVDYLFRMIRLGEIRAIEALLKRVGLARSAWWPLAVLRENEGMSQRELAKRLNLKDAAIGKAVDAMEKAGIVYRGSDKTDRRKALVGLTPAGKQLAAEVSQMKSEFLDAMVAGFSERELVDFRRLLGTVYDNLGGFIADIERNG